MTHNIVSLPKINSNTKAYTIMKKIMYGIFLIITSVCLGTKHASFWQKQRDTDMYVVSALAALEQAPNGSYKTTMNALINAGIAIQLIEVTPSNLPAYHALVNKFTHIHDAAISIASCTSCASSCCALIPAFDTAYCIKHQNDACADTQYIGSLAALIAGTQLSAICCKSFSDQGQTIADFASLLKRELEKRCGPIPQHMQYSNTTRA